MLSSSHCRKSEGTRVSALETAALKPNVLITLLIVIVPYLEMCLYCGQPLTSKSKLNQNSYRVWNIETGSHTGVQTQ